MKKIIIGFSTRKGKFQPFSWAIKFVGKTPYSHVYIRLKEYDKDVVYQASDTKVNFLGYKNFRKLEKVFAECEVPVSKEAWLQTVQFAIDRVGTPYGFKQVLGMGIYFLFRWLGINLKRNIFATRGKELVCAELAEYILNDFAKLGIKKNPDLVMPGDIFDALKKHPKAKWL